MCASVCVCVCVFECCGVFVSVTSRVTLSPLSLSSTSLFRIMRSGSRYVYGRFITVFYMTLLLCLFIEMKAFILSLRRDVVINSKRYPSLP